MSRPKRSSSVGSTDTSRSSTTPLRRSSRALSSQQAEVNMFPSPIDTRSLDLIIRQQPSRARVCGLGLNVDRRPVDPPPILQLVDRLESRDRKNIHIHRIICMATLCRPEPPNEELMTLSGSNESTGLTMGSLVSSLHKLKDLDNETDVGFFVFPDISVRQHGRYTLRFDAYEARFQTITHIASVISDMFTVHNAKAFPGMLSSTPLCIHIAKQGIKLRIRSNKRRVSRGESEEPPNTQTNPPRQVGRPRRSVQQYGVNDQHGYNDNAEDNENDDEGEDITSATYSSDNDLSEDGNENGVMQDDGPLHPPIDMTSVASRQTNSVKKRKSAPTTSMSSSTQHSRTPSQRKRHQQQQQNDHSTWSQQPLAELSSLPKRPLSPSMDTTGFSSHHHPIPVTRPTPAWTQNYGEYLSEASRPAAQIALVSNTLPSFSQYHTSNQSTFSEPIHSISPSQLLNIRYPVATGDMALRKHRADDHSSGSTWQRDFQTIPSTAQSISSSNEHNNTRIQGDGTLVAEHALVPSAGLSEPNPLAIGSLLNAVRVTIETDNEPIDPRPHHASTSPPTQRAII